MIGACVRCNSAGLAYLNNRYHDPTTGTFISVDPLVATTGDPYVYAAGNPTTLTDPDGLEALPGGEWMWEGGGAQTGKAFRDGYYHAMVNLWTDLNHTYRNGPMRDVGPGYGSSAVVDRVAGVWDKLATVGVYEWDAFKRRASNPLQSLWDDLTLTTLIEQGAAIETIMVDDAEIYRGGDFCGAEVECLIGADTLLGYDATTIGHTLRFESHDAPEEGTAAHETQHAYDVESLGGVGFVIADVLGLASCLCYRESYWEQRAYRIGANGYPANGPPRGVLGQAWSAIWGSP